MIKPDRFIFILIFTVFLFTIVTASTVKVNVPMKIQGNLTALTYEVKNGILKIEPELFNSGSVPCKARIRLHVLNVTRFPIVWSKEKTLMPGDIKNFKMYWYTGNISGKLDANLRVYYGNEILDYNFSFNSTPAQQTEDVFEIKNFRVYDDYVRFELRSNKTVDKVIVNPSEYVISWIFEQTEVGKLDKNRGIEVFLHYDAPTWTIGKVTIEIFTEDGRYYTSKSFELHKEAGIWKYLHYLIDKLSLLFSFWL